MTARVRRAGVSGMDDTSLNERLSRLADQHRAAQLGDAEYVDAQVLCSVTARCRLPPGDSGSFEPSTRRDRRHLRPRDTACSCSLGQRAGDLDNAHLMRMAGRFARRVRASAGAHGIPLIDCKRGERKHEIAEDYLAHPRCRVRPGLDVAAERPSTSRSPNIRRRTSVRWRVVSSGTAISRSSCTDQGASFTLGSTSPGMT